jgi:hypothetical protein
MQSLFSKFRRPEAGTTSAPDTPQPTEVRVNKSEVSTPAGPTDPQSELLTCEDIYYAAGILRPDSKYGISKIADMLTSIHMRDLSKDVKRASVLMALDAAGTQVDEVLQDATRRQHALDTYEAGQHQRFEEFEARKVRENALLKAELERVTAHYSDRVKQNHEQVTREKESLRKWQTIKEQETQRIAEAVSMCKQPVPEAAVDALPPLSAGASAGS